ncbi:hypothetical protein [Leifsonia sp. NPDC058230]|uniref:hypothetical protein n=1 Tax=Leifsonia sp. NPDC058230 TaxID=3346391 RepID=UPI0036DA6542
MGEQPSTRAAGGPLPTLDTADTIVVTPLSAGVWRVSDTRFAEDDAQSLVGFIELRESKVEVMLIGHGFTWSVFSTLSDAVVFMRTAGEVLSDARSHGPFAALYSSSIHSRAAAVASFGSAVATAH